MLQPVQKKILYFFFILVLLDVAGLALNYPQLHKVCKPLLIPTLMLALWFVKPAVAGKRLLLMGLFFSWLGDLFLLFEHANNLFFIFGLASFLITHIFYIIFFLNIRSASPSLLRKQPIYVALVFTYGISLVWQLYPYLGDLRIPVTLYAFIICTMLLCSMHVFLKISKQAAAFYFLGALSFVISDSLLAINKFYQPFSMAAVLIMITYCAAQFFIVYGFIKHADND